MSNSRQKTAALFELLDDDRKDQLLRLLAAARGPARSHGGDSMTPAGMLKVYNGLGSKAQAKVLKVVEEQRIAQGRVERRAAKRARPPRKAAASHLREMRAAKV